MSHELPERSEIPEILRTATLAPVEDRYARAVDALRPYLSGRAIQQERFWVELVYLHHWLRAHELPGLPTEFFNTYLTADEHREIQEEEWITNHDLKALINFMERWLKRKIPGFEYSHLVHFGLTSQDICSTAMSSCLAKGAQVLIKEGMHPLHEALSRLSADGEEIPTLTFTHGRPATPKKMSQVWAFYLERLQKGIQNFYRTIDQLTAKFGGATGDFTAASWADPGINYVKLAEQVVQHFGLTRSRYTTQIDSYDSHSALFSSLCRMLVITQDLAENLWMYITKNYFRQQVVVTETGSSAMPHKVNPCDLENALGVVTRVISDLQGLERDLPRSRFQRDLKDSVILRDVGEIFARALMVFQRVTRQLGKLSYWPEKIQAELEEHPEVLMEPIQLMWKRHGIKDGYVRAKEFSRGRHRTLEEIQAFASAEELDLVEEVKALLRELTPTSLLGM